MLIWSQISIINFALIFFSCVNCSLNYLRSELYTIPKYKMDVMSRLQTQVGHYWPKGIINYFLDNKTYSPTVEEIIENAIKLIESSSCIKFELLSEQPAASITWIHITNPNNQRECVHGSRFMQNGEIVLVLGYECLSYENVLHALLHGIGFKDEVTHPHRDKYIRVLWNNIQPGYRHLYRKQPADSVNEVVEYDPLSIMHFHDRAFSINGRATVIPLEHGLMIAPSSGLSQLDRMRLQLYFGHECKKRSVSDLLNTCKASFGEEKGGKSLIKNEDEHPESKDESSNNSTKEISGEGDTEELNE